MIAKGNNNLKTWSTEDLIEWYNESFQSKEDTEEEEFWKAHETVINALKIYYDFLKKYKHGSVIGWVSTDEYSENDIPIYIDDIRKWFEEIEKNFGPNSTLWKST